MTHRAIIYGGRGALGSVLVPHFKSKGWWVCSVDMTANEDADVNVVVDSNKDWEEQENFVSEETRRFLGGVEVKVEAILNVAGGWAGGAADSKNFIKNADLMWRQSVWSSTIAAKLATRHLLPGGLLVLPGAQPATKGTPRMIGYGMAKAAVHHLTQSLAAPGSGMPEDVTVLSLLPITLDTPNNRKFMPEADFSTWTSLEFVANLLYTWAAKVDDEEQRPKSGSLVQLVTRHGKTDLMSA